MGSSEAAQGVYPTTKTFSRLKRAAEVHVGDDK